MTPTRTPCRKMEANGYSILISSRNLSSCSPCLRTSTGVWPSFNYCPIPAKLSNKWHSYSIRKRFRTRSFQNLTLFLLCLCCSSSTPKQGSTQKNKSNHGFDTFCKRDGTPNFLLRCGFLSLPIPFHAINNPTTIRVAIERRSTLWTFAKALKKSSINQVRLSWIG